MSRSTSPLFNLSLEEHLLRVRPSAAPLLFIYRNDPCIVIGRNQNPWKELNVDSMRQNGLPLVRRRSGGGAVYHDLGNTNFSIHVPRETFERRSGAELISRALNGGSIGLRSLGRNDAVPSPGSIALEGQGSPEGIIINERNDLTVQVATQVASRLQPRPGSCSWQWTERKISGSAFKILTHRAYHHGTMLLSSNLSALGSSLRNEKSSAMLTKGVDSVRSPVVNLCDAYRQVAAKGLLTHEAFTKAVLAEFWQTYDADSGRGERLVDTEARQPYWHDIDETHELAQNDKRVQLEQELGQWQWLFGQCPEFETEFDLNKYSMASKLHAFGLQEAKVWLRSKNGILTEVRMTCIKAQSEPDRWERIVRSLEGKRFDDLTARPPVPQTAAMLRAADDGRNQILATLCEAADNDREVASWMMKWFREAL